MIRINEETSKGCGICTAFCALMCPDAVIEVYNRFNEGEHRWSIRQHEGCPI